MTAATAARVVAIIPARHDSVRFPGKVLADRTGHPLIRHVHDRVGGARTVDAVIVATDDPRIAAAVEAFGGRAVMTRRDHPNGTSRLAEVAADLDAAIIVNVQGDEPEVDPAGIDRAVERLRELPDTPMSTLACPFAPGDDPADPNLVKVVTDRRGRALYFSRAPIPVDRDGDADVPRLRHIGLYVYRREFLLRYVALEPTPLERAERLEQLRVLEHGESIAVALVDAHAQGIDTPEQYEAFVARFRGRPE